MLFPRRRSYRITAAQRSLHASNGDGERVRSCLVQAEQLCLCQRLELLQVGSSDMRRDPRRDVGGSGLPVHRPANHVANQFAQRCAVLQAKGVGSPSDCRIAAWRAFDADGDCRSRPSRSLVREKILGEDGMEVEERVLVEAVLLPIADAPLGHQHHFEASPLGSIQQRPVAERGPPLGLGRVNGMHR